MKCDQIQKEAFRIQEFCAAYGIGRSKVYQEIAEGKLEIFKIGKLTLISRNAAQSWMLSYQKGEAVSELNLPTGTRG